LGVRVVLVRVDDPSYGWNLFVQNLFVTHIDKAIVRRQPDLRTWGGEDLTVAPSAALGKVYIRGQQWMGDRYDALFEPGHASQIWRDGVGLPALDAHRVWRAHKKERLSSFKHSRNRLFYR
jgi:hypothetical protein